MVEAQYVATGGALAPQYVATGGPPLWHTGPASSKPEAAAMASAEQCIASLSELPAALTEQGLAGTHSSQQRRPVPVQPQSRFMCNSDVSTFNSRRPHTGSCKAHNAQAHSSKSASSQAHSFRGRGAPQSAHSPLQDVPTQDSLLYITTTAQPADLTPSSSKQEQMEYLDYQLHTLRNTTVLTRLHLLHGCHSRLHGGAPLLQPAACISCMHCTAARKHTVHPAAPISHASAECSTQNGLACAQPTLHCCGGSAFSTESRHGDCQAAC
jgi:hypothetical protein